MLRISIIFITLFVPITSLFAQKQLSHHQSEVITTPRIFAEGVISAGDYESHPEFSISGGTLYFVKSGPDLSKWTICVSYFKNNKWSAPAVASFSGQYMDADPYFSKDGKVLYFISNRL
jgi:hypothetical protein